MLIITNKLPKKFTITIPSKKVKLLQSKTNRWAQGHRHTYTLKNTGGRSQYEKEFKEIMKLSSLTMKEQLVLGLQEQA